MASSPITTISHPFNLRSPPSPSPPKSPPIQIDFSNGRNSDPSRRHRRLIHLSVQHQDLQLGRAAHAAITKTQQGEGSKDETHLLNTLISMYLKLGCLSDARKTFDCLSFPDVVSYTSLISVYAKCGQQAEAVNLFCRMRSSGIDPNEFTFVAILTSCIRHLNCGFGSQLHALAIRTHHVASVCVSNAIMGLIVKCGCVDDAFRLFGEMPSRDVSSWNTIISGMVKEGRYDRAFELFRDMQTDGFRGDGLTFSSLLTAAVDGYNQDEGKIIHAYALKLGLELDLSVSNALVPFYTKFASAGDVVGVFDRMPVKDVISWTGMVSGFLAFGLVESALEMFHEMPERNYVSYSALIAGLCRNGEGSRALNLFIKMVADGLELSDFTLTSVVNACAMVSEVETSKQIHGFVVKAGCQSNAWIEAALLDMCTKCGRLEDAQKMFNRWIHKDSHSIAWTSLVLGNAKHGRLTEAISLFHTTITEEDVVDPMMDKVAVATVLGVCGALGFHEMGKQIHSHILKSTEPLDLVVGNAVFSMYSKCRNMDDAIRCFNLMPQHDLASWNALMTAYLLHRQGNEALAVWETMEKAGIKPDHISFVLIIAACKYTNLNSIDTCRSLFLSLMSSYHIKPASEHYAAMVDVLGYWGCFDEATELIKTMPFKPDALVWRTLLESCRQHTNVNLGRQAIQHLLALEPRDTSTYVLVSNLYSASGRWYCSERIRSEMKEKRFHKHPARSWMIHKNVVHSFYTRDRLHMQAKDIYSGLDILISECMKVGYVPDTSFVLHEVEEYQKKDFLFYHSAKLAVCYGLLVTSPGRSIQVMKNIRLCGDCHTFFKYVSTVTRREIALRDTTGFHCFKGGGCSCKDNW